MKKGQANDFSYKLMQDQTYSEAQNNEKSKYECSCRRYLKEFTTCMCITVENFTQNNKNIHIFCDYLHLIYKFICHEIMSHSCTPDMIKDYS